MAELDHVFCLCPVNAHAAAQALHQVGLTEGSPNRHEGQGTACRRFFFDSAYIELLWVSDPKLAHSAATSRTRLWERWSRRTSGACPFGIVLRAGAAAGSTGCPFPSWPYRPSYLPPDLSIDFAEGTTLEEPEYMYLGFQRDRAREGMAPTSHKIPANQLTHVNVGLPAPSSRSAAAQTLQTLGLISLTVADEYVISLTFDSAVSRKTADLRPAVPIILHW